MIDALLSVPGRCKAIYTHLTTYMSSTRMAKVDYLTANVAVASTAVSNADLTPTRAAYLDNLSGGATARRTDPLISPPIAANWLLPLQVMTVKVPIDRVYESCAGGAHSTNSTSYVTAISITGAGVLNLVTHYAGSSAIATIKITIDGVVVVNGVSTASNSQKVFVGCVTPSDATATGFSISLDQIPFRTSLLIEHLTANATYAAGVVWKLRRTA